MLYIIFHFLVRNIGCGINKAMLDLWELYDLVDDRVDFSYVHIRYFIGDVYHMCLQDTIQSTEWLCLLCQAMLIPMPLRPLLLIIRSCFTVLNHVQPCVALHAYLHTNAPLRIFCVVL